MSEGRATPSMARTLWYLLTAVLGVGLFIWTVVSVGPREIAAQLHAAGPMLSLVLVLAGVRFWLQAASMRILIPETQRPGWGETFTAIVAGEGAGYFAWGPISREPTKALLLGHRVPEKTALKAAVVERVFYSGAAVLLIIAALGIAAIRYHVTGHFLAGLIMLAAVTLAIHRYWTSIAGNRDYAQPATATLTGLAVAQEATNVIEAYVVLAWLGAAPTLASVVVLEGLGRLMNSASQFIPGKFGVTEAATTVLADSLQLGGAHGLSLALVRRARSLLWSASGIGLLAYRAAGRLAGHTLR